MSVGDVMYYQKNSEKVPLNELICHENRLQSSF